MAYVKPFADVSPRPAVPLRHGGHLRPREPARSAAVYGSRRPGAHGAIGHRHHGVGIPYNENIEWRTAKMPPEATEIKRSSVADGEPGGIITFGGGVALYSGGQVLGGLGGSGDSSCADHAIAYRIRHAAGYDGIPGGVGLNNKTTSSTRQWGRRRPVSSSRTASHRTSPPNRD
jgi:Haem-degrading